MKNNQVAAHENFYTNLLACLYSISQKKFMDADYPLIHGDNDISRTKEEQRFQSFLFL